MKKVALLLIAFLFTLSHHRIYAFSLSDSSRISLLTCAPGEDLYSAFGHTAIRVTDYKQQLDIVFNYGTFDYSQPYFYINFIRGRMLYMLTVEQWNDFVLEYAEDKRTVTEQDLNLSAGDREGIFDFLYTNSLPENREYYYDFFWDNCATRPRDIFEQVLGSRLQYHTDTAGFKKNYTLHDMLRLYVCDRPWVNCGFDLILGLPCEKIATPRDQTFLPDYLAKYEACATIDGSPFVTNTHLLLQYPPVKTGTVYKPIYITLLPLLLGLAVFNRERRKRKHNYYFDFSVFFIAGLLGCILLSLWVFTTHYSTPKNLNMLWLIPAHIVAAFFLLKKKKPVWLKYYFVATSVLMAIVLITWKWNPQPLNIAFAPLIVLLGARAFLINKAAGA